MLISEYGFGLLEFRIFDEKYPYDKSIGKPKNTIGILMLLILIFAKLKFSVLALSTISQKSCAL